MVLYGEGEYNLNILKEIKVTDSFIGLSQDVRACQLEEHIVDCETRNYLEHSKSVCGCLPFPVRTKNQVDCYLILNILPYKMLKDNLCKTQEEVTCSSEQPNSENSSNPKCHRKSLKSLKLLLIKYLAFRSCSGLTLTSYNKYDQKDSKLEKQLTKSIDQYKKFKKQFKLDYKFKGL